MAWSTRQVAELAGTTVKAVRHYHRIGLLDVPERAANGYKQYGVPHLVRLVQIRRMRDLGVPLSEIARMDRADEEPDEAIRALDRELEATVDRLNRVREELALLLRHRAPAHVPSAFAPLSGELTERQRSLLTVYSSVLSEDAMAVFHEEISRPEEAEDDFEALPPDAGDGAVDALAARLVPVVTRGRERNPASADPTADAPGGARRAERTLAAAVTHLYNPAQMRVLKRLHELLRETPTHPDRPPDRETERGTGHPFD
ncbi:MerR family transcriptional regulator [Nocardiopsis sp. NPDC058789]|uniref:MerR family transcriptional regulator n=1 Tax=Nocardiopsis eucommiae TaxID=2831970 RepID=A0A975QL78_9ACTN|nr:MerR family transcriptional regulator [Nocardiopsis eucommiae]